MEVVPVMTYHRFGQRPRAGTRALLRGLCFLAVTACAQTTIDPVHAMAWGANTGWMNWYADEANGARLGEYVCSGFLYAGNLGWINLGNGQPVDGIRYRNDSEKDFGVNLDAQGELSGLAYGANIGWLAFTNRDARGTEFPGPRVDVRTGYLSGFVYSANTGWINLSNSVATVRTESIAGGADTDDDDMADAWEYIHAGDLDTMNRASDLDEDGATDVGEYRADTDPLSAGDLLAVVRVDPGGVTIPASIIWSSKLTRAYYVQQRDGLDALSPWVDAGGGLVYPDFGEFTTQFLEDTDFDERYFRIEAVRPLAP